MNEPSFKMGRKIIIDTHDAYFYEAPEAQTLIIFIHGIMGSPKQFNPMIAAAISHGYSVSAILLPGHGGTITDFNNSNRHEWAEAVHAHIDQMSQRYASIVLVGHSMGSLLALSSFGHYPHVIKGIVAVATPLRILLKPKSIKTSYSVALGRVSEDDIRVKAANDFCSVNGTSILAYAGSIPRFFDLFYMMRNTRKNLAQVEIPTLLIHSVDDEVANIRSVRILEKKLQHVDTLKLSQSGHYYYPEQDTKIMIKKFVQFLNNLKTEMSK